MSTASKSKSTAETTISNPTVAIKYKAAAEVANAAIQKVFAACNEGSKIIDLCTLGDTAIEVGLSTKYTRDKKLSKGVAYPTSVSVNNVVCHCSPSSSDPEGERVLKKGDVVRVQLGAQVDGYSAICGDTVVVGASESNPVTGRTADAIAAANHAADLIQRMIKPGNKNMAVTDKVQRLTKEFGCKPFENMLCYEQKHNGQDGDKQIILNPGADQRKGFASCEFAPYEVYLIEVFVTTGEGQTKKSELRTNVYKKTNVNYQLKMKTARAALSEITSQFGNFAFSLRSCKDERKMRMGLIECTKMGVVQGSEVQEEKPGEAVAQVTFTALVTPTGVERITQGNTFDTKVIQTEKKVEDTEIRQLLETSPKIKKKKASAATSEKK